MDYMDDAVPVNNQDAIAEKQIEQQISEKQFSGNVYPDPYSTVQAQNLALQKEYLDVLKHYTDDDTIPQKVKQSKWGIFGKGLQLTFLEEKDLPLIDMFNQILRIDALMAKPAHRLTFEESHQLDQIQLYFYLQAKRAIGTNQGKVNERTLQVTQIGQSISTQTMNTQQRQRSILTKLRGMF